MPDTPRLLRPLTIFDVTNLVVGSIIGADIYIAAAMGARLIGPVSLLIWFLAGIMAFVIALSFAYCARIEPVVGGPYAYTKVAFGEFPGFMVGWGLLLSEWFSLAVFPVAFAQYATTIFSLPDGIKPLLKVIIVLILFITNYSGTKSAGRFNDILTLGKILPLLILMIVGSASIILNFPSATTHFTPFIHNPENLGQALVLIFWAYAGFELSTIPANEIKDPETTIPRAILIGMAIVMVFYVITNFIIVATVTQSELALSPVPLLTATDYIFNFTPYTAIIGFFVVGIGALLSIMGADESGTIGTSRLMYALALDGYLPRKLSLLHPKYQTPYLGLAIICSTALVASLFGGIAELINASVFLLALSYFATCCSSIRLAYIHKTLRSRQVLVSCTGILCTIILMLQVSSTQIINSLILLLVGIFVYKFYSPKKEQSGPKQAFLSREAILKRTYEQSERFLAYIVRRIKRLIYRLLGITPAWASP